MGSSLVQLQALHHVLCKSTYVFAGRCADMGRDRSQGCMRTILFRLPCRPVHEAAAYARHQQGADPRMPRRAPAYSKSDLIQAAHCLIHLHASLRRLLTGMVVQDCVLSRVTEVLDEGFATMHTGLQLTSHEEQEALEQFHATRLLPAGW